MNNLIYFSLPSWIANLGVVPWLRSLALRRVPMFFFFRNLLLNVTRVLETIFMLLLEIFESFKAPNIASKPATVKTFLLSACIFFSTYSLHGSETHSAKPLTILLSVGEHREIDCPLLLQFSVTNPDVVSYKHLKSKKKMLIKGKKLGLSELIVWEGNKKKSVYRLHVLSKQEQLKLLELAQGLQGLGLKVSSLPSFVMAQGEVSDREHFFVLQKLKKKQKERIHFKLTLSQVLQNELIAEVYEYLFQEHLDNIRCQFKSMLLVCEHPSSAPPSKNLQKYLEDLYGVEFLALDKSSQKNFQLKLKLIQMEKINGEELSFGLDRLEGNPYELFSVGLSPLLARNQFLIEQHKLDLSTLAEPQTIAQINQEAMVQVGAEIPYVTKKKGITIWKFAGLEVKLKLKQKGDKLFLHYYNQFTQPSEDGAISGNKAYSEVKIKTGEPLQLFQVGLQTVGKQESSFPLISKIPILGALFRSKSDTSNYKQVTAYIVVEEYETVSN